MDVEVFIVGGGVVGLACAAESARKGKSTLLVERHESFGQETSSRNSEVIHSGIYYAPGSLKAKLCVAANQRTYSDCERFGVWHRRCGKLIVAVSTAEEPELEKLRKRGITNGVMGLQMLDATQVRKVEPQIRCTSAIEVPSAGIFDSHELMRAYLNEARAHGADCVFGVEFRAATSKSGGYEVCLRDTNGEETRVSTRYFVNAGGLSADTIAQAFGIDVEAAGYRIYPNRGHYYRVSTTKSRMVTRLIYPVPSPHLTSLGIHIVMDRSGQCRLGPDAEYLDGSVPFTEWYKFDDSRLEKFYNAVARYFPALKKEDLSPDQVGVRAKIQAPGEAVKDFIISEESKFGLPGLINLIGIESPGLTCAGEIARTVLDYIN